MIQKTMEELDAMTFVISIEDIHRISIWVAHVTATSPIFYGIYSNKPLIKRLFTEAGFDVRGVPFYRRGVYLGTEIRHRIVDNREWRPLVPPPAVTVIEDIGGVERLKQVSE